MKRNEAVETRKGAIAAQILNTDKEIAEAKIRGLKKMEVGPSHDQTIFLDAAAHFAERGYDITYYLSKTGYEACVISWERPEEGRRGTIIFCDLTE